MNKELLNLLNRIMNGSRKNKKKEKQINKIIIQVREKRNIEAHGKARDRKAVKIKENKH